MPGRQELKVDEAEHRAGISVLAFDMFGTTVDWRTGVAAQAGAIAARCGVEIDGADLADDWRGRYLPAVATIRSGEREWRYLDAVHRECLDDLLAERGLERQFGPQDRADLVRAWHRLPAWDDAAAGLARLRRRYTVAALSNGGFALMTRLVKAAELPFDCILSADLAGAYKPDPAAYLRAAQLLDVAPAEVMMVAAHAWDLDGARNAGLRTAYVSRPNEWPGNPGPPPETCDVSVDDFTRLADLLGCE